MAIVVNLALIALFGIQHSVMARQGFKRAWTRIVPKPIERSVYVLFASLALMLLFAFWRPIDDGDLERRQRSRPSGRSGPLFGLGWLMVLVSTFLINHFELFGLQQAWFHTRGREAEAPQLRQPFFYRFVRHPLYLGFFLAFWATPTMTAGHLLLAVGMSVYMLIAIRHEERDLVDLFGESYAGISGPRRHADAEDPAPQRLRTRRRRFAERRCGAYRRGMDPRFAHIRDWIFDLDNCLYPASTGLFALIDERMGAYIQRLLDCDPAEARRVQKAHFHTHGTTLAGLMKEHGVDPHDFLDDVHDIALDRVSEDRRLAAALDAAARAQVRLHQRRRRPMPAACSKRSASTTISTSFTTFTPASFAQARPPRL